MALDHLSPLPQSVQTLVRTLNRNPRQPQHWLQLGEAFENLNDLARAKICFQQCLKYDPKNEIAHRRLDELQLEPTESDWEDWLNLEKLGDKLEAVFPAWSQILLSLFSFLFTVMLMVFRQWQTEDMVWGFWITSLVTGYAIILSTITGSVFGSKPLQEKIAQAAPITNHWLLRLGGGLFMLAFFTVHFGMFHFVIGQFLYFFFPAFVRESGTVPGLASFNFLIFQSLQRFWPLVLLSLITQINALQQAWHTPAQQAIAGPYKNVVRMHLTISALAFFSLAGRGQWLALVVLVFYYLPWELIIGPKGLIPAGKKSSTAS